MHQSVESVVEEKTKAKVARHSESGFERVSLRTGDAQNPLPYKLTSLFRGKMEW